MLNRDKDNALAGRHEDSTAQAASRIARMLAVSGFGVDARDYGYGYGQSLTILSAKDARSLLTIRPNGYARWEYEPCTGPASSSVAVTSLILYVLDATGNRQQDGGDYRRFLLKGAVGRQLRDRGLNVSLRVDENLESLEVSAEIEVTNPARPARGIVRVNDLADIEWRSAESGPGPGICS